MKRKLMAVMLISALALAGCGGAAEAEDAAAEAAEAETIEEAETEESEAAEAEEEVEEEDNTPIVDETVEEAGIDAFLTMPDYKGLELEKNVTKVTDEDVIYQTQMMLQSNPEVLPDGTKVEEGMTANIDFEGTIDGEAFDGGSSTNYDLQIGSGSFIEGFEDQIIGHVKGDEFDVNVTFPEDYGAEDLAGRPAVFKVKINDVLNILSEPTDEWVKNNTEYSNVEEFNAGIKKQLEDDAAITDTNYFSEEVLEKLMDMGEFKQYPKNVYENYYNQQVDSMKQYAESYGMEYNDDFLAQFGYTDADLQKIAKNYTRIELITEYIMQKEGLTEDSEEFANKRTQLLTDSGFASVEEAVQQGITEEQINEATANYLIIDVVINNAKVKEVSGAEAAAEE